MYITPSAFRFIRKEAEVVEEEVTLVTKTDDSIVVVEPKAYVPTHASTWASNSMRLRWEKPGIHEPEELHRYQKYSEEFRGLCARVHDCTFYYMDSTTEIDILSVIGADKCPYRKYEQLRLHSLEYQLTSARERWEENQNIEDSEKKIGDNIVNAANCLLDCISKSETDMKHVTGEQLQRVLNPVLEQCNEILRRIACLRLPPVYPRLLELTDAGPGVGVSSAESRIRILEKARVYGNEKVLRIHRAREDSGQNEAERLNACIGDALCDGGSLKWQIYETLHGLSEEEVKSLSTSELDAHSSKVMEKNAWAVAEEVCLRIDDSPAPRGYISAFLVNRPENQFFYNREYLKEYLGVTNNQKSSVPGHGYFSKLEQFESFHCEKGELYMEYRRMACKEKTGQPCKFCEKDEITSPPLPTRRPYPGYGKLPNFHYLSWTATPTSGREPDDFQPRAQIKRLFEESELVCGDSEAIRRFSDKYIVPEKLVAEYVEHLSQIKMRKEKKKEETERERTERLNREYNDIDWVGLYNSDKLASLRVDELSLYFSHHKIAFKGKKADKVAIIKAHIGSLLYTSMERQQPRQPPLRNVQQQVTSSLSEVETDSQSDVVDRVVGSSPSSSSNESSPETDFIQEPCVETLPTSKYGRKRARVERDNYVSWDKIVF